MSQCRQFCASTHVRKLFHKGKFLDYSTVPSLHAQNGRLTRSDPVSQHFNSFRSAQKMPNPAKVGRLFLMSASFPRHKLPIVAVRQDTCARTIHTCQAHRISAHVTKFILIYTPVRSCASKRQLSITPCHTVQIRETGTQNANCGLLHRAVALDTNTIMTV